MSARERKNKEENSKSQEQQTKEQSSKKRNLVFGCFVLLVSIFLIVKFANFVLYFAFFGAGLFLLYYSLKILGLKEITGVIDKQLHAFKKKFLK